MKNKRGHFLKEGGGKGRPGMSREWIGLRTRNKESVNQSMINQPFSTRLIPALISSHAILTAAYAAYKV